MKKQEQFDTLREFVRRIFTGVWDDGQVDAFEVQDLAEKAGIIVKVPFDPAKHADTTGCCEPGDDWFVFAPWMKAGRSALSAAEPAKDGA